MVIAYEGSGWYNAGERSSGVAQLVRAVGRKPEPVAGSIPVIGPAFTL